MAEPARKRRADIEPEIRPDLNVIDGGGQSTPDRANLRAVQDLEENPDQPTQQDAADGESNPRSNVIKGPWAGSGQDANWDTNVTPGQTKEKMTVTGFLKKRGPLGAILALLLGGGIFAGLALPSLLLIHIQEMMMDKFDVQNTSMTVRSHKVLYNKIMKDATQGSCNVVQVACRFQRMSNAQLRNLEKNGITALDKSGAKIDTKKGLFPNTRPATYVFKDNLGYEYKLTPQEFSKAIQNDPRIKSAFFRAYNPRMVGVADAVFRVIQKRFGFSKTNKLEGAKTAQQIDERIRTGSAGRETGARAAIAAGSEASEEFVETAVRNHATKMFQTLRNAGRGSAVSLVAGTICLATNIPRVVISVVRSYQIAQLVLFAMNIATPSSAQKAGSSSFTPEVASALGTMVMSSINSFGMRYTLFGDTNTGGDGYKRMIAGASVSNVLGGVDQFTQSQEVQTSCSAATNPATGVAINAGLTAASGATLGATLVAAGLNIAIGWGVSQLVEFIMPWAIDQSMNAVRPYFNDVLQFMVGDYTQNMTEEETGAAYAGGMAHLLGETANAGGNMPLTVDQAVEYKTVTRDVQLAYAEADRATLSPFDASNKNTFLGSIVNSFLPYYAQLHSVSGVLKTMANIPLVSIQKLVSPVAGAAEDPKIEYTMCDDPAIKDSGVAAGPFCNIIYGIPPEYLSMDPQEIVDSLVASGDIDRVTGQPVNKGDSEEGSPTSLYGWTQLCTEGGTDQASNCRIYTEGDENKNVERRIAMYALYTIDRRIQETMDGTNVLGGGIGGSGIESLTIPAGEGYYISSGFGPRPACPEYGNVCSTWHRGLDFAGGSGVVKAALSGTVTSIGDAFGNNTVVIDHENGLKTLYLHMYTGDILVKVGDVVTAGQTIGKMGSAGQSTGTHLHFTVEADDTYEGYTRDPSGQYIDPAEFFQRNGISV